MINRLNIFITGNHPIPDDSKFDALRDRLIEVPFPSIGRGAFDEVAAQSIRDAVAYGSAMPVTEQANLTRILNQQRTEGLSFRGIKRSVKYRVLTDKLPAALRNDGHLRLQDHIRRETPTPRPTTTNVQAGSSKNYSTEEIVPLTIGAGTIGLLSGILITKSIEYIFWYLGLST